jgi:hypothetical protein
MSKKRKRLSYDGTHPTAVVRLTFSNKVNCETNALACS